MDASALRQYLDRIGFAGTPRATLDDLAALQRAHLETVPFENLDIMAGKGPLPLDEPALFDKIVRRRRGGICYEQNFLFAAVLRAIGFDVLLKAGRVKPDGTEFDHAFLLVRFAAPTKQGAQRALQSDAASDAAQSQGRAYAAKHYDPAYEYWFADVGYAYNFAQPLLLAPGLAQSDGRDDYLLHCTPEDGAGWMRSDRIVSGETSTMFSFGPKSYCPDDFWQRAHFYSTSPDSRFYQGPLVCIDKPDGRIVLSMNHLTTTFKGMREVADVQSSEHYRQLLGEVFGLEGVEAG